MPTGKRLTLEEFILRAKKVHKNKYSYGKVVYVNSDTKIKIFCKKHKEYFWQTPYRHVRRKQNCPRCSKFSFKPTTKSFIEKAKKVHGGKYRYCKAEYTNAHTKVKIFCKKCLKHFTQLPYNHVKGRGCPVCGGSQRLSQEEFINRAKKIYNEKFDYSLVKYRNNQTRIRIVCPEHGVFEQTPSEHLNGKYGCSKCAVKATVKTHQQFEEQASKLHKNKYKYHRDYQRDYLKIKIACPEHGSFSQTPSCHLQGKGCPSCGATLQKTQEEILRLASKTFRLKFLSNAYLPELKGLELDIYNECHKLAFEYQGEQHYLRYETGKHFLTREGILAIQKRDRRKKRLCKKAGIKLICIPCYEWNRLKSKKEKHKHLVNVVNKLQ